MPASFARACCALLLLLVPFSLAAQTGTEVHYDVSWPDAAQHETEIVVTFPGLDPSEPLEAVMSRVSPGRYALHEFAKNVYAVSATDGAGNALDVFRGTPYAWTVSGHDGTVRLRYTLYANHADGTYAGVDTTHAHYNMPAAFMYARGLEDRPVRITFHPIHDWKIATQLIPTDDPHTFTAPDLAYFMDSPTELSDFTLYEWRMGPGEGVLYRMALHHLGTDEEGAAYVEMAKKVIAEQAAVFGGYPDFDYGSYTFLADYLPWVQGDGMEHRNSTILTSRLALEGDGAARVLGTLAHEHFHAWNMERLRDDALEPFDFSQANPSRNLWFGEGFTSYYDGLTRVRAGLMPLDAYAADLAGGLNAVIHSPARAYRGPAEMSAMAPFRDAAVSIDETNYGNTFVSYYTWGEVLGMALDLTLRTRYDKTLDDYMQAMWAEYGQRQEDLAPVRGYDREGLERVLAEVSGDATFAADFFAHYIDRGDVPDFASLVEAAGLMLRPARSDRGFFGNVSLRAGENGSLVVQPVPPGSAAAEAGLASGDRLLSVDGVASVSAAAVSEALADNRPGDVVTVVYEQRGVTKTARVALQPNPTLELVTFEQAGRPVTDEIRAFREAWLGSKAD